MTVFYKPNFSLLSNVKETVRIALAQLRRNSFVISETFAWTDFEPQIDYAGMGTSVISNRYARYININKLLFLSVDFSVTVAAPLASYISIVIPGTTSGNETGATGAAVGKTQCFACTSDFNTGEVGLATISAGTNILYFTRPGNINYPAANVRIAANGFLEIK